MSKLNFNLINYLRVCCSNGKGTTVMVVFPFGLATWVIRGELWGEGYPKGNALPGCMLL